MLCFKPFTLEGATSQGKRWKGFWEWERDGLLFLNHGGLWKKVLSSCSNALGLGVGLDGTGCWAQKARRCGWRSRSAGMEGGAPERRS